MDSQSRQTLFERLGGESQVAEMVDQFYYRVLFDKTLRDYFLKVDMSRVRVQQRIFFSKLFGSSEEYTGKDIKDLHRPLGIQSKHYDAFIEHMKQVLMDMEKDDKMIEEVIQILEKLRSNITTSL